MEHIYAIVFPLGLVCCFLIGLLIGNNTAMHREKARAIEAGVAHWVIDAETGERSFEFIVPKEGE